MMYDQVAKEFPDYPLAELPELPEGFTDISWHNDVCPCFSNRNATVYVDFPDREMRDFPDAPRFTVHLNDMDGAPDHAVMSTDDWSQVLAILTIL